LRGFILGTIATAIAFYIVITLLPDFFSWGGDEVGLLVLAVVFGLVNGVIGPILRIASFPISFMTMGLFGFIIGGVLLLITAFVADLLGLPFQVGDFPPDLTADTLIAAVIGAIVFGLINSVVHAIVPD
jgi:putative membrane protein